MNVIKDTPSIMATSSRRGQIVSMLMSMAAPASSSKSVEKTFSTASRPVVAAGGQRRHRTHAV